MESIESEQLFVEFQDVADKAMRQIIDGRFPHDPERSNAAVQAGKALILLGCSYIGSAARLDADAGLEPGLRCLDRLKEIVRLKQSRN
jgi:hypothetical protein